jgi:DNA-binding NarL/FixJ family response regulator
VLIVDDHAPFRALTRRLLSAGGYQVVGEAADGAEALRATHALRPDVVLLDVQLPGRNGFQVAEELADEEAPPIVVFISLRERDDYEPFVSRSSAAGFISKAELSCEALTSILGARIQST